MAVIVRISGLRRRTTVMRRWGIVRSGTWLVRSSADWCHRGQVGRIGIIKPGPGASARSLFEREISLAFHRNQMQGMI